MNANRLLRHPLGAAVLVGLSLGLFTQQAAATDEATQEVIVYGAEVAAEARAQRERMQAEIQEYLHTLNLELREALDASLPMPQPVPQLQLSTIEISTRG